MIKSGFQCKQINNTAQKKIEGNDLGKTTKTNFEKTVNHLKTKPQNKVLEDEYIAVCVNLFRGYNNKSNIYKQNWSYWKINKFFKDKV